ncbi:hypothetical protein NMY22_g13602 [Coprinellus aureogranulatus]|nr:hypothetical protein NMY22_g13602 [Coprinellus aureogranulatus]
MARNCPQANTVKDKGSSSSQVHSYGVYLNDDKPDSERYRHLAETTQAAHEIEVDLNAAGWAFDSDSGSGGSDNYLTDDDEAFTYAGWSDYDDYPTVRPLLRTLEGHGNEHWTNHGPGDCDKDAQDMLRKQLVSDPILEKVDIALIRGAPYRQDIRKGSLSKTRFSVHRTEGGYIIIDEMYHMQEEDFFLPWEQARKPQFNIAGWYQRQLNDAFGIPEGLWTQPAALRPEEEMDPLADAIEIQLSIGGPYPGETYALYSNEDRFQVSYNREKDLYEVTDRGLLWTTRLWPSSLEDKDFSVAEWYAKALERAYEDLWDNITMCHPEDLFVDTEDDEVEDLYMTLKKLEDEALAQQYSVWELRRGCSLILSVGGVAEPAGKYPLVQMPLEIVSGLRLCTQTISADRYKEVERNSAARKDVSRNVPEPVTIVARIAGRPVRALLDSGSLGDFMSTSLADQLNVPKVELTRPLNVQLAVQGSRTRVNYGTKVDFEYQQIKEKRYFDIINLQNYDLILGTPFMHQHRAAIGLNPPRVVIGSNESLPMKGTGVKVLSSQAMSTYEDALEKARRDIMVYAEPICKKAGETPLPPLRKINHRIPIIDKNKTYHWRASKCPEPLIPQWVEKRNEYVKTGRWVPCTSYNTVPMLCIPKPTKPGEPPKLRTVFDLRERNANTKKLTCPLPDMEGILRRVAKAKYRSIMDGKDAYEQIRIEPEDVQYSAMATPDGPMVSKVMQQGDCNAVATFQTIMTSLFSPWLGKWIDIYLDDIVIYSDTLEEHIAHCKKVIDILRGQKFFLNKDKFQLLCKEMKILGRIVTDEGIRMDGDKVDALVRWKTPTNRELLRGFLGAASYLADDIDRVRVPMGVLFNLTSDKVPFRWDFTHQRAFEEVKRLASACRDHHRTPLQYGPGAPPINVVTDACVTGIAGVVSQGKDWKTAKVAAFFSAKLNKAQQNYPVHELEMLAGLETMLRHRDILQGAKFTWYTDHKGLRHLLAQRDLSGRQARWLEKMSGFDFVVEYVPGSENILSDALSRLYANDAPGTVRARGEYTDFDIVSNDALTEQAVTMPLYVGKEGAMAVPPPEDEHLIDAFAITRSRGTEQVDGAEKAATAAPRRSSRLGNKVETAPRVQGTAATKRVKAKRTKRDAKSASTPAKEMASPGIEGVPQDKPKRAYTRKEVLGAETGRPETGKEFAARMRNHFTLKGPRDPKEGVRNNEAEGERAQAPSRQDVPVQPPASLVEVIQDTNGLDLRQLVKDKYQSDNFFKLIMQDPKSYRNFKVEDGLIFQVNEDKQVLCIPHAIHEGRNVREFVIAEAHGLLAHLSARKTIAYLRDHVWWKDMIKDTTKYCETCTTCRRTKSDNQKSYGLLHTLEVPHQPWDSIGIDFVGPLPESSDRNGTYDCITVVIDRLTGMVHLVPSREDYTAREIAELVFAEVYKYHGLPRTIVSDRDKWFTSTFWDHLHKLIGTKLKMSSAYHPETDGATERANKTMNQMIRQCIGARQRDWSTKLPAIEFAINSARSESTGYAPFFLNYGRMPRSFIWNHADKEEYPGVRVFAAKLKNAIMSAHDSILAARVKQTRNANRKRQLTPFTGGDLVYVSTENIRFEKGLARKFLPKYIGPYKIVKDFGNNSYKVDLPARMKQRGVHDVFHSSKLRIHVPNDDRLFPGRADDQIWEFDGESVEQEFAVDKVLSHEGSGLDSRFELLWRDGDVTWLPYHKISHLTVLRDYLEAMGVPNVAALPAGGGKITQPSDDAQVELGVLGFVDERLYKSKGRGSGTNSDPFVTPPRRNARTPEAFHLQANHRPNLGRRHQNLQAEGHSSPLGRSSPLYDHAVHRAAGTAGLRRSPRDHGGSHQVRKHDLRKTVRPTDRNQIHADGERLTPAIPLPCLRHGVQQGPRVQGRVLFAPSRDNARPARADRPSLQSLYCVEAFSFQRSFTTVSATAESLLTARIPFPLPEDRRIAAPATQRGNTSRAVCKAIPRFRATPLTKCSWPIRKPSSETMNFPFPSDLVRKRRTNPFSVHVSHFLLVSVDLLILIVVLATPLQVVHQASRFQPCSDRLDIRAPDVLISVWGLAFEGMPTPRLIVLKRHNVTLSCRGTDHQGRWTKRSCERFIERNINLEMYSRLSGAQVPVPAP